jgi:predicted transglutaminase-like cysteine proteinase
MSKTILRLALTVPALTWGVAVVANEPVKCVFKQPRIPSIRNQDRRATKFGEVLLAGRRGIRWQEMHSSASGWLGLVLVYALGLGLAVSVLAAISPVRAEPTHPNLFGYTETRFDDLAAFKNWTGMLRRYYAERLIADDLCMSSMLNRCHMQDWKKLLAGLEGKDRMSQLDAINRHINRASYVIDSINYRIPNHWATPRQFFTKDGDCEDFAIAKYFSLRLLGLPTSAMRIVVLQDEKLRIPHAVLAVYLDGNIWILDNRVRQVVSADRIRHYRPFYSVNEEHWWLHLGKHVAG